MKKPRTVKNSKQNKKEEASSLENEINCNIIKTRRRRKITKNEVIRKPISISKKLDENKSNITLNEIEKHEKLFEIQKKIELLKNEKKILVDPSFSAFKKQEEKQERNNYLKKDKDQILSISNSFEI